VRLLSAAGHIPTVFESIAEHCVVKYSLIHLCSQVIAYLDTGVLALRLLAAGITAEHCNKTKMTELMQNVSMPLARSL